MRQALKPRPCIEILEDRFCPSLTIKALSGDLLITGTPSGTTGLTITRTGANYQITDGATNKGTFSADSITLTLAHYDEPITINLDGQSLGGNIVLSLGTGNLSSATRSNPVTIDNGTVGGSVSVLEGSINETLNLGNLAGTTPLHVGDSVIDVARSGSVNGFLFLSDGSFVGGALTVSGVPSVQIGDGGAGATIGGPVTVNASKAGAQLDMTVNGTSVLEGSVTVVGTPLTNGPGNLFLVEGGSGGATFYGNVNVNLGDGLNLWQMGGTYAGNVTLAGGSGSNTEGFAQNEIDLNDNLGGTGDSAIIAGSLTVTTGNGSTEFLFPSVADGALNTATVAGNVSLTFGNGINDLGGGAFGGLFDGTVDGNITVKLGNGTNVGTVSQAPGGTLSWQAGNGTNSLTLGENGVPPPPNNVNLTPSSTWLVSVYFGSGTNSLSLANTGANTQILNGIVDGDSGTNTLSQDADWILAPTLRMNF